MDCPKCHEKMDRYISGIFNRYYCCKNIKCVFYGMIRIDHKKGE